MTLESFTSNQEKSPKIIITPPAIESLINTGGDSLWPEKIIQNPELKEKALERVELLESLDMIFKSLPIDMSIEQAFENNLVKEEEIVKMYNQISNMLENDLYTNRFILYIPFEILPNRKWVSDSVLINDSKDRFLNTYMKSWNSLLSIEDIRASFIDGDFTDNQIASNEIPRVVKAAHMVSKLIERNLISFDDVIFIIQNNLNTELCRSMVEGLCIGESLGIFASFEENIVNKLKAEFLPTNNDTDLENQISESRQSWLDSEQKRKELEKTSDNIVENVLSGELSQEIFKDKYFNSIDIEMNIVGVKAFRKVVEYFSKNNIQTAKNIYSKFELELFNMWSNENPKIKDAMTNMWSYFKNLSIIDDDYINSHNLNIPSIEEGVMFDKKEFNSDLDIISSCAEEISHNPELSKSIFPVLVFSGSRTKGYGLSDSDFDISVFIRPGVMIEDRDILREKIISVFKQKNMNVKPIEFWLDENMSIINIELQDQCVAKDFNINPIFSGIMCGDDMVIKTMYEKLLSKYLYFENDYDNRSALLHDLERNNLQYRLMHKGYKHLFPKQGKDVNLSTVKTLDKESSFWDAGYRRLASKIFVKKVFLPQIHE